MAVAPEYLHLVYPGEVFRAYLYGRASHDPTKKGRSVAGQLTEGQELCDTHGWPVVGVFDKDVDYSASRHAKRERRDFEAMLEGIRAGECRIVVAWEASRYYRDLEAYVRLRAACLQGNVLLCYNGQIFDMSKREDRKATAQDALAAEDEAEGIQGRSTRTHRQLAEKGAPVGPIPWGYARRYDPDTGDLIGQFEHAKRGPYITMVFDRFDGGWTMYRINEWLNGAGEDAEWAPGIPWTVDRVGKTLRTEAYAGRRVHNGEVHKALWPPLVKAAVFDRVQLKLAGGDRRWTGDTRAAYLLSGIGGCLEHGEERPRLKVVKGVPERKYSCPHQDASIRRDWMDAYVEEALLGWLASPQAVDAFRRDGQEQEAAAVQARLARLEQQLDESRELAGTLGEDGSPGLSPASLASLERSLTPQIAQAQAELRELSAGTPPLVSRLVGAVDVESEWAALELDQQREVVRTVVNVGLHKAHAKGIKKILPGRIMLTFVGEQGFVAQPARAPQRSRGAKRSRRGATS